MYSQLSTSIISKEVPPTFVTVRGSFTHEHNKTTEINNNPTGINDSGVMVNAVKRQYGCEDV